jgi:uncharacterized protein YhbP (UPF0306 family)
MGVDVPDQVVRFLGEKKTLTIATVAGDGTPHAATLVYANDGATLYVWAHAGTTTAEQLGDGTVVGFAIDEYADDPRETKGVQGTGSVARVSGEELAKAGDLFGQKFPKLRPGASAAVSFFRIDPGEIHYIDNSAGEGEPESDEYRRQSFS